MKPKKRTCRNCDHFRESYFCGYISSLCTTHGSLDVDQHERHPDITGATCPDFTPKQPKHEPTEKERIARMTRALWPNGMRTPKRRKK